MIISGKRTVIDNDIAFDFNIFLDVLLSFYLFSFLINCAFSKVIPPDFTLSREHLLFVLLVTSTLVIIVMPNIITLITIFIEY